MTIRTPEDIDWSGSEDKKTKGENVGVGGNEGRDGTSLKICD